MDNPEHFEIVEDHAESRLRGRVTLEEGVQAVSNAIAFACTQQVSKLLVDITGLYGFPSPGIGSRYFLVREWARVAGGRLSLVIVSPPDLIDHEKIGVLMAKNAGLHCNIFASEEEALEWLKTDC